tara:strand:+ start:35 stop:646 length:612 start_codon:yes stop_codon:yes gene_type:complete
MKTIVITGPSSSGKSYLTKKLCNFFYNSIVLKTDSYYRDNIIIRFLSLFLYDIYDRPLSIKKNEIMMTLRSIHNKDKLITFYKYDFKQKHSSQLKKRINYKGDNQFLILEGIFAHRLNLNYQETINIVCDDKKEICLKRRVKRDKLERGRKPKEVHKKFYKSWQLFNQNIKSYLNNNKVIVINPSDKVSLDKLIKILQKQKNN